jgi:hypothetical protein
MISIERANPVTCRHSGCKTEPFLRRSKADSFKTQGGPIRDRSKNLLFKHRGVFWNAKMRVFEDLESF